MKTKRLNFLLMVKLILNIIFIFDLNFNKIDCFYNPNIKNYNAESSIGLDNHDDI